MITQAPPLAGPRRRTLGNPRLLLGLLPRVDAWMPEADGAFAAHFQSEVLQALPRHFGLDQALVVEQLGDSPLAQRRHEAHQCGPWQAGTGLNRGPVDS